MSGRYHVQYLAQRIAKQFKHAIGCSKEQPYWHASFEYPQHIFKLRLEKKLITLFYLDAYFYS